MTETLELRLSAQADGLLARLREAAGALDGLGAAGEGADAALEERIAGMRSVLADAKGAFQKDGGAIASALADGLKAQRGGVSAAADELGDAAKVPSDTASRAKSAGAAFGQGLANGIASKKDAVSSAVGKLVSAALARLKSDLSIHSPSRVTFGIGENFTRGFEEGVAGGEGRAVAAVGKLASSAAAALSPVPARAAVGGQARDDVSSGEVNLTIPLEIDGVKLGEACIRGVNLVTKRAGRVMLEM